MSSIPGQFPPSRERGCFMPALFVMLLIMGIGTFWRFFLDPVVLLIQAQRWEKVPCRVYYATKEAEGGGSTSSADKRAQPQKPNLRYRFTYAGKRHDSGTIWVERLTAGDVAYFQKRFPEGDNFCYVNPANPAKQSLLYRGFRPQLLKAIFPLLLTMIGLVGLGVYYWPKRRRRREWRFIVPEGRSRKKRRGLRSFLVMALFAIAYNGVVYFLVREVIESWSEGFPDFHGMLLTAFAIPFIALGPGSIALAVYLLMKLFNPRPLMQLSPPTLPLGSAVEISWRFAGRIRRLRRLRIFIEGREEATYTRGTKLYTDREVFASIPLLDTTEKAQIPSGRITFTMPAGAVPTFHSPHNNVSWVVRIVGHIRFWPDAEDEIEMNVVPATADATAEAGT
jgi:hypothetical protein